MLPKRLESEKMKAKPDRLPEKADAQQFVREYALEITPHTWWGRSIVVVVFAAILSLTLFFFSLFIAFGVALVALTILIGMLKSVARSPDRSDARVEEERSSVINTQRSLHDRVCRPRDSSKP